MTDEASTRPAGTINLRQGDRHSKDFGSLRYCPTTDCPAHYTPSERCDYCLNLTLPSPPERS